MTTQHTPFPIDPERTAIAIGYKNQYHIADRVLPRVPVGREEFRYLSFPLGEGFTIPNARIGRKSEAAMVDFSADEMISHTQSFALEDLVPDTDVRNAPANWDPLDRATEQLRELLALAREKRTADLVFDAGNYDTDNKKTLSSGTQFSDASSDPLKAILNAMDSCLMRPNIMVLGQEVWTQLQQHPKVLTGVYGRTNAEGVARKETLAEVLDLEEILVGQSKANTAAKGKSVALARVWGKSIALLHRNTTADTLGGLTFGFTAQFQEPNASIFFDPRKGLSGGHIVRVSEALKELVIAPKAGYLFSTAVA